MTKKPILLRDLITRLEQCDPNEIYVEVDESEPDVFVLPLEAIAAIATLTDGSVKARGDVDGYIETFARSWPGGTLTSYKMKCTNDASHAGNQVVKIEPAVNSPVFLQRVAIEHDDSTNRTLNGYLFSSGGAAPEFTLFAASVAASTPKTWPEANYIQEIGLIHPDFEVVFSGVALAVAKISIFFLQYAYIGTAPTITETGPTGSAFSAVS